MHATELPSLRLYPRAGRVPRPPLLTERGIFTGGGARAAWFKDSEGNILAVIQSL